MDDLFKDERPKKKRREPKPDAIWDCLVKLFYPSGVPSIARGKMNRCVADLKMFGATPQSIREHVKRYKAEWPKMACTVCSLVAHWDAFPPEKPTLTPNMPLENHGADVQRRYAEWKAWSQRTGLSE